MEQIARFEPEFGLELLVLHIVAKNEQRVNDTHRDRDKRIDRILFRSGRSGRHRGVLGLAARDDHQFFAESALCVRKGFDLRDTVIAHLKNGVD